MTPAYHLAFRGLLQRPHLVRVALAVLIAASSVVFPGGTAARDATDGRKHAPVLAYYYIWFSPKSWDRAKADYPLLGRYSSDDPDVMRKHIRLAKAAGIDGFIVSWKSTDTLNRRLAQLAAIARQEHFKLAIIYQGLDFERDPVSADQVARDLDDFVKAYGSSAPFDLFERPLVIWSGTWEFSPQAIGAVTAPRRDELLILGSQRNREDYERIAGFVDGDAYYWSSVDPAAYPDYEGKLQAMSDAVHSHGGLWIAPVAPGFDGRLIGHKRVIERAGGATLRQQFDAALKSSPNAIGLISWNEFSEMTHMEPSERYGDASLKVVADILGANPPASGNFDSSEPGATTFAPSRLVLVGAPALAFCVLFGLLLIRAGRRQAVPFE
jgi:hypothetical protein